MPGARDRRGGATRQRFSLAVARPFDLAVAAFGHGWVDLAPNTWDAARGALSTAALIDGVPTALTLRQQGERLTVHAVAPRRLPSREVRQVIARMLRLDEDFTDLWALCAAEPKLAWVARLGAGRLLRAPTLFEDLVKLLFTTNTSWAGTRSMVARLVAELGDDTPSGARAFPAPERLLEHDAAFFRERVRVGYRASALVELARRACAGELLAEGGDGSADELRRALLALPGFGPYAAGQALRLLGHYEDLALDSWCRAELAARSARGKPPADRTIARRYARYGRFAGLVLWLDLTRAWHVPEARVAGPLAARRA